MSAAVSLQGADAERLIVALRAMSNPHRLRILEAARTRLSAHELARQLGMTRQGVRKHIDVLRTAGLMRVERQGGGIRYQTDPAALFAVKENLQDVGTGPCPVAALPAWTVTYDGQGRPQAGGRIGFWMVHGDRPGRWLPVEGEEVILGRAPASGLPLPFDPFLSQRHAAIFREDGHWMVMDLHSTNGTSLDFRQLQPGLGQPLADGSILSAGRVRLVFRAGA